MYKRVYSPTILLRYLKNVTYKGLPFELWDRYLWLYEPVIELLSKPVSDKSFDNITLYANEKDNGTAGIAYVRQNDSNINILLDTSSGDGLEEFIHGLKEENYSSIKITVKSRITADLVKEALGTDYIPGMAGFFARQCSVKPVYKVDEVKPGDGYLFKSEYSPDGWLEIDAYIQEGTQYFTVNEGDMSISTCGLCYLTAFRAEVVGVGTRESYMRRGYAKSVCAHAMAEALQNVPIVTWSARITNEASCAAAKSLGFEPFAELYHFEISTTRK